MLGASTLSVEQQAADLVDFLDIQGHVLTYSAAIYLCRQLASWGSQAAERLRSSLASIGIELSPEQVLEALERLIDTVESHAEAEADWELLETGSHSSPQARRLTGALFEASRALCSLVDRSLAIHKPFPWGLVRPTTAGLLVQLTAGNQSSAVRLRCLTRPLPSRALAEHRQHAAAALRRVFEEKHRGWLDGVAALSTGASTAELVYPGFRPAFAGDLCVESRVFAALEAHQGMAALPARLFKHNGLKLYTLNDLGRSLLGADPLDVLSARYQHFIDSHPGVTFSALWHQRLLA